MRLFRTASGLVTHRRFVPPRALGASILVLVALLGLASRGEARKPTSAERETFKRGNVAYESGDFDGAVTAYGQLVAAGLGGLELDYNLGNAFLKQGRVGPAILHYRRALRANPQDSDARANLDYARRRTQDARPLDLPDPWPWLTAIRPGADRSAVLYLLALNVAALAFAFVRVARDPLAVLRPLFGISLAAALLMALVFFWELRTETGRKEGVVFSEVAEVRTGPGDSYTIAFQVHEGTEVALGQSTNGWTEISVAGPENDLKGWVAPGAVEAIP